MRGPSRTLPPSDVTPDRYDDLNQTHANNWWIVGTRWWIEPALQSSRAIAGAGALKPYDRPVG
jgi:hypothetical protein